MPYLESLAVRFVETDGLSIEEQNKIIADAADYVCSGYKNHPGGSESPALQLAVSIQRWQSFTGGGDDDNDDDDGSSIAEPSLEKKARAHRFMARTLAALPASVLKPREVKLFTSFFCSMYQLHDANLAATTEALSSLIHMDKFDPSSTTDILTSVGSMEPDNFTKQVAKVRLAIFNLIDTLFNGPPGQALRDRQAQGQYLLKILPIFSRERDPCNLLQWFRFLDTILKEISLSTEAADATFESFSPFFPISIRKSTVAGPEVTEEQLKEALNSCFSANGMLSHRTIPFLLGKLDAGASLTAAAKLDILRTVNACITSYEPAEKQVVSHVPQIWSSLKYEVRHGDVPEAIRETLAVFTSLSRCLASGSLNTELKSFVDKTWNDCAEDLENPTYTEQAGSIFISVAQAHLTAFRLICPRLLGAIQRIITRPKSPTHTKTLITVLNNLLRARRSALTPLPVESHLNTHEDDSITVTRGIYFRLWKENSVENPTKEQSDIAKLVLEGLSQVVKQRRPTSNGQSYVSDCDEAVYKEICGTLSHRVTNCFIIPVPTSQEDKAIDEAAVEALRTTITFYPAGYGKMMSDFIGEVSKRNWTHNPTERSYEALSACCSRLASIGCLSVAEDSPPLVNFVAFVGGMLKVLGTLFEQKSDLKACAFVIHSLAEGLQSFVRIPQPKGPPELKDVAWNLHKNINGFVKDLQSTFPDLVKGQYSEFEPKEVVQSLSGETDWSIAFLYIGVYTVVQLYQHATKPVKTTQAVVLNLCESLVVESDDDDGASDQLVGPTAIWRDRYIGQVAKLATIVLSELDTKAQADLCLNEQILGCFHNDFSTTSERIVYWNQHNHDMISELSVGVARAILPDLVLKLYNELKDIVLGDLGQHTKILTAARGARENIALLLANKYDTRSKAAGQITDYNNNVWIHVLTEIREALSDSNIMANMEETRFRRIVSILTGAMTRGDRFIDKALVDAVSHAAINSGLHQGKHVARFLSKVFASPTDLGPLIKNPIHKQRTYHQCIHPVIDHAYPLQPEQDKSIIYAVFVLHAVKQLALDQYEGDADRIVRIALAAMQKATHVQDIEAACSIILDILKQEPTLLQDHVSSIVAASQHVYLHAVTTRVSESEDNRNNWGPETSTDSGRLAVRKRCIRILRVLPQQMDDRVVRPNANGVLAFLLEVLADGAREVRHLAQTARNAWLRAAE